MTVSDTTHPLVAGMEPFEETDEIYLCEYYGSWENPVFLDLLRRSLRWAEGTR